MADKPAAMAGVYVDMKFMPGLKMARISIEIPIEHSNEFIRMFGTPDRVNPVAVGIARLQEGAYAPSVPESPSPAAPVVKAETGAVERTYTNSQIAALKLMDPNFCAWLRTYCENRLPHYRYAMTNDEMLKEALGIDSKRELDAPNSSAAELWKRLLASYDYRNQVRA